VRSVEEHQRVVTELIRPRPAVTVALTEAQRLVLADDVVAQLALPVFDNSAMDGYAVRSEDTSGATPEHPVVLPVAEDIPAGRTDALTLQPGTAHRIMTGAPVPAGATAIVPVEDTDGGVDSVAIRKPRTPGAHIRRAGEDVVDLPLVRETQMNLDFIGSTGVAMAARRPDRDVACGDAAKAFLKARQVMRYFVAELGRGLHSVEVDVRRAFHVILFLCGGGATSSIARDAVQRRAPLPVQGARELLSRRLGQI